jgi:16S rRNA (guanine527-N7)-methyltransferase
VFPHNPDDLAESAASLAVPLSSEQIDRLVAFEELLREYAVPWGLVSRADAGALRERHLLDSLRAAPLVDRHRVVDIGSGAGLPGIVVAVARPSAAVHLVEPRRRRVAFLELAAERLGLANAVPVAARIEHVDGPFDVAFARAFAGAGASWSAARRVLGPGGRLVYFAGARSEAGSIGTVDARAEIVWPAPLLASFGPLVIMSRH